MRVEVAWRVPRSLGVPEVAWCVCGGLGCGSLKPLKSLGVLEIAWCVSGRLGFGPLTPLKPLGVFEVAWDVACLCHLYELLGVFEVACSRSLGLCPWWLRMWPAQVA